MIKRVLLIWPYYVKKVTDTTVATYKNVTPRFPLGISYCAAHLEKNGYDVRILDCFAENPEEVVQGNTVRAGMTDDQILEFIKDFDPHLVGVSQMFSYLEPVCKSIFKLVKTFDQKITTVWGGTHPTVEAQSCLRDNNVDYIIMGEGEAPLLELIKRINKKESVEGMPSLAYVSESGEVKISKERLWIEDLDNHVLPDREKLDLSRYATGETGKRTFNMVTSRGCPFACTFCSAPAFYQKRYRGRSPECVVDEMELLINQYGAEVILVEDENLTVEKQRLEAIMDEMIKRDIKIEWNAEAGLTIAYLDLNLIQKMKKTGFIELRLALESGDAAMLKTMKKPLVLAKARRVVSEAREAGMRCVSFLLMGMPGETIEQMQNTVDFAEEIGFDWNIISMVLPLPGTEIHRDLIAGGGKFDFVDLERYTRPVDGVSTISSDKLSDFRERANNRLNFEKNFNLTKGDPRLALKDFKELSLRYEFLPKVWYYLGLAYEKIDDFDNANLAFLKAHSLDPEYKDVALRINNSSSSIKEYSGRDLHQAS
jgi:anaerobic magnesium-protoporphyrin IX monomethyl ester cyclase